MSLEEACTLVERELKRLCVTTHEIEYSEGCALRGLKGSHRSVSLYSALQGLRKKLDGGSNK